MSTDLKTENLKYPPTYRTCEEKFQMLREQMIDLESETFREIWFSQIRQLRQQGCWRQASELTKMQRAYDEGRGLNPAFRFIRINESSNMSSNRSITNSNVLSKEKQLT